MTRPVPLWLLTGLVLALVVAANHRPAAEPLDPATMTELNRRLDLVVSGGSDPSPQLPRDRELSAANRNMVSDLR